MNITDTAQTILEKRYFVGKEKYWEDLCWRVAESISDNEDSPREWRDKFYDILYPQKFLPNSPCLMNAGTDIGQLCACFVLPVEDSMSGIFDAIKNAALVNKTGGGTGFSFSRLRPKNSKVQSTNGVASGPVSFMRVFNEATEVIKQGGRRRGANMGVLRVDHPDIVEFIKAKEVEGELSNFNLSVAVTDEFMKAVKNNHHSFDLIDPKEGYPVGTITPKKLWNLIINKAHANGEPGILFIDAANRANPTPWLGDFESTNPCFHPDTVIETVHGRVKIKDIKEPTKVYTMLKDGSLGISDASASFISKRDASTLRLKVRSGKELVVTPEHKVYVDEVGWVEAKDLKIGDRLVHLCRARRGVSYSGIKLTTEDNRAYRMEHRFIAENVYDIKDTDDVHHIDGDTYNNSIDNFEILSHSEHSTLTRFNCANDHQVKGDDGKFISSGKTSKTIIPMPEELRSSLKSHWDACIESITEGPITDVYDIQVKDTHNLIANFLVAHNCGEQWLLPYEACSLSSINLEHFIKDKEIDWKELERVVRIGTRFMDNVIDVSTYPIPEIEEAVKKTRKIGLGIMGLHDMLIQLELPYDSDDGRHISVSIMSFIYSIAVDESYNLSNVKGYYPATDADHTRTNEIRRNAALTSIQPTGTVSMIADCSSGCEPYFSVVTKKTVMDGKEFIMVNKHFERIAKEEGFYSDALMKEIERRGTVVGIPDIPEKYQELFKCAQDISVEGHIRMQAALQPYVDASISKTINMPNSATVEDVSKAYMLGWELGCKGLTVYRDGSRNVQVLTSGNKEKPQEEIVDSKGCCKASLPDVLNSKRFRMKGKDNDSVYIIICYDDNNDPLEVFAKFPFENQPDLLEKRVLWTTVCRLISLALRYGIPVEEVTKQLDKSSGVINDLPGQLSKLIKSFSSKEKVIENNCPECYNGTVVFEEGCMKCPNCGWSKCG